MAAQKGTLNLVGDAAFMVLAVPLSALKGVDEDGDSALSRAELDSHADVIREQVNAGVQLLGSSGALPLQLMMLDISRDESKPETPARHLVVMGRFQLTPSGAGGNSPRNPLANSLSLRFSLFGTKTGEQRQDLTITRQSESQWLSFTPGQSIKAVLPDATAIFQEYARTGVIHVLSGADHMLFLLVVVLAGWRWRTLLGALTCFTAGHALTLAACAWGGWSAPERVVEPAIAATIIGMAAFDAWSLRRSWPLRTELRLALVFACALIHGLGLAGALGELTQWSPGSSQLIWALAGFNFGIEMAQLGVATLAMLALLLLNRLAGAIARQRVIQVGSGLSLLTGTFWLIERLAQGA
jgi:hydrogenase/urease accessory protein HupE